MNSIALSSAMRTNLASLSKNAAQMRVTTERISSGRRVTSVIDNPTNFFASANLQDRASALSSRLDGLGQSIQTIQAADHGITTIRSLLGAMKGVVDDALSNTDADARRIMGKQFNELIVQIGSVAKDSDYKGVNLLQGSESSKVQFGENFDESTLNVQGINLAVASSSTVDSDGEIEGSTAKNGSHAVSFDVGGESFTGIRSYGVKGSVPVGEYGGNFEAELTAVRNSLSALTTSNTFADLRSATTGVVTTFSQILPTGHHNGSIIYHSRTASANARFDINFNGVPLAGEEAGMQAAIDNYVLTKDGDAIAEALVGILSIDKQANGDADNLDASDIAALSAGVDAIDARLSGGGEKTDDKLTFIRNELDVLWATHDFTHMRTTSLPRVASAIEDVLQTDNAGWSLSYTPASAGSSASVNLNSGSYTGGVSAIDDFIANESPSEASVTALRFLQDVMTNIDIQANLNADSLDGSDITAIDNAAAIIDTYVATSGPGVPHEFDWGRNSYQADLAAVVKDIEEMDAALRRESSKMASGLLIIAQREDFSTSLINILEEGADKLTLADLNEEGANLLALQTSNQLGIQALSLSNQSSQSVLSIIG